MALWLLVLGRMLMSLGRPDRAEPGRRLPHPGDGAAPGARSGGCCRRPATIDLSGFVVLIVLGFLVRAPSETLSRSDVRFAVRLTPARRGRPRRRRRRRRAPGAGRGAGGRGRREPARCSACWPTSSASPGATSGSWPARRAARSSSSSTASTPERDRCPLAGPAGMIGAGRSRSASRRGRLRVPRLRAIGSVG